MQDGFFCLAHWLFANEYYKISVLMPCIINDEKAPKSRVREVVEKTMFLCNIFVPLIESICDFELWQQFEEKNY